MRRICEEEVKALPMDNGDQASQQAHDNQIVGLSFKYKNSLQFARDDIVSLDEY